MIEPIQHRVLFYLKKFMLGRKFNVSEGVGSDVMFNLVIWFFLQWSFGKNYKKPKPHVTAGVAQ